ncbi:hypothetical protein HDU76_002847, partial [Blyttiomyces sp. JEL0837]
MGKDRKKNRGAKRPDPTGGVLAPMDSSASTSSSAPTQALPIVNKLRSLNHEDRSWAGAAISNLVLEDATRLELLKGNVVSTLVAALDSETMVEVKLDMVGAVRNLASFGGDEVCQDMARKGIVLSLVKMIPEASTVLSKLSRKEPFATPDDELAAKTYVDLTEQLLFALSSIAEASDVAVKQISASSEILVILLDIFNPQHEMPFKLALGA